MAKTKPKTKKLPKNVAVVSLSQVAKSGNLSARFHVNQVQDRSPYLVQGFKLKEAVAGEWSKPNCYWLTSGEKKAFEAVLEKALRSHKALERFKIKLSQRDLNEE